MRTCGIIITNAFYGVRHGRMPNNVVMHKTMAELYPTLQSNMNGEQ